MRHTFRDVPKFTVMVDLTDSIIFNARIYYSPVLMRHLWQLKTGVSLQWCLISVVLLNQEGSVMHKVGKLPKHQQSF